MDKDNVIHVRVPEELKTWLEKRAEKLNIKESAFIRQVLETLQDWEGNK